MTCIQLESCFNDWAGTRAREAKSRDARTIFLSDVSLDGLTERTNHNHLGEMILQSRCPLQVMSFKSMLSTSKSQQLSSRVLCFLPVTKFKRVSGIYLMSCLHLSFYQGKNLLRSSYLTFVHSSHVYTSSNNSS